MIDRYSNIVGTLRDFFRIGAARLKSASGKLFARNTGDTAYIPFGAHSLQIHGANATNAIVLQAPTLATNVTWTLPDADGTSGQLLGTNAAGTLGWYSASANGVSMLVEEFTQATSSPLTIGTPAASSIITQVIVEVTSAAGGGAPLIEVGIAGDTDRDMLPTDSDLKLAAIYETNPNTAVGGSPAAVIATITPDGQTFSGKVYIAFSNPG